MYFEEFKPVTMLYKSTRNSKPLKIFLSQEQPFQESGS